MKLNVERSGTGEWRKVTPRVGVPSFVVLVSVLAVGGVSFSVWHLKNTSSLSSMTASAGSIADGDTNSKSTIMATSSEEIILALGRHMVLPKETIVPQVALITDATALLREQDFYRGAQDGDALIVFPISHLAIIYSPKRDRIVTFGPVRLKVANQ